MNSKPLRALTPLQDKCLALLVYASNRDGGADPWVSVADFARLAERLDPAAGQRAVERRTWRALARLQNEGVAVFIEDHDADPGQRVRYKLVRSLPAAARVALLFSRTGDNERKPPTRRKRHAISGGPGPKNAPQDDADPVLAPAFTIKAPKPQPDPNERL
jgi:hypothetical protein